MIIGKYDFNEDRPYIMGILNVTPDSFSDGGLHNTMDTARAATEQMIKDGADIIDVGGESTRPGHEKISDQCEIDRVCPVIEMIKKEFDVPVSLDTYKGKVAEAGILAGADLINDIWGLKWDKDMADIIARHDKACCLMHNRDNTNYVNYLEDAIKDLDESVQMAYKAGNGDIPVTTFKGFKTDEKISHLGNIKPCIKGKYRLASLKDCLPKYIKNAIIEGVLAFDRYMPGYACDDAVISGIEARTSSPVRITRNEEMTSYHGLIYPCGEGAGYAGGITSAAVDGIKAAEAVISRYKNTHE